MKIILLASGMPQILDRAVYKETAVERKLRENFINPFSSPDPRIVEMRRRMREGWERSLEIRWHKANRFTGPFTNGLIWTVALSWSRKDVSPLIDEFDAKWRILMWHCFQLEESSADLHICHVSVRGNSMGPLYNIWRRDFTDAELLANYMYLSGEAPFNFCINPTEPYLVGCGIPDLLPMQGRSEGAHVSKAIESYCYDFGIFTGNTTLTTTWAQVGCAWEDCLVEYLKRIHPDEYEIPGELERDGIFGTPDVVRTGDGERKIAEIKLAWISSKHTPHPKKGLIKNDKFFRYRMQIMAYCKMLGTRFAELQVNHINGNWKNFCPTLNVWGFEFTQRELDGNWAMIKGKSAELQELQGEK